MNTTKKGFTLVELVIVIAVIAILAGVLIPTFSNVVAKANQSADLQEITNKVETAYIEFVADTSTTPVAIGKVEDPDVSFASTKTEDNKVTYYGFVEKEDTTGNPAPTYYDAYVVTGKYGYAFEVAIDNGSYTITAVGDKKLADIDYGTVKVSLDNATIADTNTTTADYLEKPVYTRKNLYIKGEKIVITVKKTAEFPEGFELETPATGEFNATTKVGTFEYTVTAAANVDETVTFKVAPST